MAPPPLWNPADTLRRRGDLVSTGRQLISLAPTAQWVTLGEDWSNGRQPRQKIRQGAMPQGQSRPSSSKRPGTYPTPAWQVAGGTNPLMSFPLKCGQRFSVPQRSFRAQQRLGDCWLHGWGNGYAPSGTGHWWWWNPNSNQQHPEDEFAKSETDRNRHPRLVSNLKKIQLKVLSREQKDTSDCN